jgi:hypothetical protein
MQTTLTSMLKQEKKEVRKQKELNQKRKQLHNRERHVEKMSIVLC